MEGTYCPSLVPAAASYSLVLRALEVAAGTPLRRGDGNEVIRPVPSAPLF